MIRHRFDLSSMAYGTHKQARLGAPRALTQPRTKARVQVISTYASEWSFYHCGDGCLARRLRPSRA